MPAELPTGMHRPVVAVAGSTTVAWGRGSAFTSGSVTVMRCQPKLTCTWSEVEQSCGKKSNGTSTISEPSSGLSPHWMWLGRYMSTATRNGTSAASQTTSRHSSCGVSRGGSVVTVFRSHLAEMSSGNLREL